MHCDPADRIAATLTDVACCAAGGCQVAVHEEGLWVFGGHTVLKQADGTESDKVHDDVWRLDLASLQVRTPPVLSLDSCSMTQELCWAPAPQDSCFSALQTGRQGEQSQPRTFGLSASLARRCRTADVTLSIRGLCCACCQLPASVAR